MTNKNEELSSKITSLRDRKDSMLILQGVTNLIFLVIVLPIVLTDPSPPLSVIPMATKIGVLVLATIIIVSGIVSIMVGKKLSVLLQQYKILLEVPDKDPSGSCRMS